MKIFLLLNENKDCSKVKNNVPVAFTNYLKNLNTSTVITGNNFLSFYVFT